MSSSSLSHCFRRSLWVGVSAIWWSGCTDLASMISGFVLWSAIDLPRKREIARRRERGVFWKVGDMGLLTCATVEFVRFENIQLQRLEVSNWTCEMTKGSLSYEDRYAGKLQRSSRLWTNEKHLISTVEYGKMHSTVGWVTDLRIRVAEPVTQAQILIKMH